MVHSVSSSEILTAYSTAHLLTHTRISSSGSSFSALCLLDRPSTMSWNSYPSQSQSNNAYANNPPPPQWTNNPPPPQWGQAPPPPVGYNSLGSQAQTHYPPPPSSSGQGSYEPYSGQGGYGQGGYQGGGGDYGQGGGYQDQGYQDQESYRPPTGAPPPPTYTHNAGGYRPSDEVQQAFQAPYGPPPGRSLYLSIPVESIPKERHLGGEEGLEKLFGARRGL